MREKKGLTRRDVVVGAAAVGAAGCGRTAPYDIADLAASEPEEEDMTPEKAAYHPPNTTPIHLTASTTLASNTTGGVNAIALKNPAGLPMEILEVKWRLEMDANIAPILGGLVSCKLDLGKFPLTNGFVPVWNFNRSENTRDEGFISPGELLDIPYRNANEYTWRLPRPLYIPAGTVLVPTLQHRGLFPYPINARVSYSGRTLEDPKATPKRLFLPYASSYVTRVFDVDAEGTDQSTETDLVNVFDTPLYVQRFTGRVMVYNNVTLQASHEGTGAASVGVSVGARNLLLRMVDSHGRPVVKDFTPFRSVFAGLTRSWEMEPGVTMEPRSFYNALVRYNVLGTPSASYRLSAQGFVGVVGWREISGGGAA